MDLRTVRRLQKTYGVDKLQSQIEDGSIWKFEGSTGRFAMEMLKTGVCYLGNEPSFDYYSSKIPSRKEVAHGSCGSRENAIDYWTEVENGNFDYIEHLEVNFCDEEFED